MNKVTLFKSNCSIKGRNLTAKYDIKGWGGENHSTVFKRDREHPFVKIPHRIA